MRPAPEHPQERARLAALRGLHILDTGPEPMWDRLVDLASLVCETPIALVSLVDEKRQWFKARRGLAVEEANRDLAFCAHAILRDEILDVEDATVDDRFSGNPWVTGEPRIRFYAGMPFHAPSGEPLGTICVIDQQPKTLTPMQREALRLLAAQAEDLLRVRSALVDARDTMLSPEDLGFATINAASHHLRTPMVPIMARLVILEHKLEGRSDVKEDLAALRAAVARLERTIGGTLDGELARFEHDPEAATERLRE